MERPLPVLLIEDDVDRELIMRYLIPHQPQNLPFVASDSHPITR